MSLQGAKMGLSIADLVEEARQQISVLDMDTADEMRSKGVRFIDVREPSEHSECAIAGALNIPRGVVEFATLEGGLLEDKTIEIVLYCRCGGRAALAALSLQRMGFKKVHALNPGFYDWKKQGRRIEQNYEFPKRS
jgi:rhodanese-related sulfurtransferase